MKGAYNLFSDYFTAIFSTDVTVPLIGERRMNEELSCRGDIARRRVFFSLNFLITTMFVICDSAEETQRPAVEWLIRPLMKPQPSANRNQCR